MKRSVIGLVVILAMLAAVFAPTALAQPLVQTSTSLTKIFFEPDAGSAPFLNIINSSKTDLKIEVYIMTSGEIFNAIGDAVNRGVKVQVILTEYPYNMGSVAQSAYDRLTSLGAQVKWAPARFVYDHAKFIIADDARALFGTSNYTYGGTTESFEANVITTDPHLVTALDQVFTADWTNTAAGAAPRQYLVLSPNSESDLQWLIDNAHQSVTMVEEEVPEGKIFSALESAAKRGVDVKLIEPQSNITHASSQYALASLSVAGVHVSTVKQPFVHAKMIISDNKYLFIGSENVSTTSMYDNREVGVILDNPDLVSQAATRVSALEKLATPVSAALPTAQAAELTEIAAAPYDYIGKLVTVRGTVEAVFGPTVYFTSAAGSQIAGLELWLGHVQNESPALKPGQIVNVKGAVDIYNGQLEISAVTPPTILPGTALLPFPFQPTLDKLGNYDGLTVLVKGTVENYAGTMSISDGTTTVRLLALTPLPPIMSTAVVYVEGVVVNESGNYVIAPIRFYSATSYTPFKRGVVKKNPTLTDLRTSTKLYYDQTVSTTGVVSAVLSSKTAYITADGYGMRLYGEHGTIVPGDIVAVNGVLSSYGGSLEIDVSAIKVTGHTTAPAPIAIKTGEAAKYPEMLVKASGTVSNVSGKNFDLDDGSGAVTVYMPTGSLPASGSTTTVIGIALNYKGTYEISAVTPTGTGD